MLSPEVNQYFNGLSPLFFFPVGMTRFCMTWNAERIDHMKGD